MKNDKEKFKKEFKKRIYNFILQLLELIDSLPKNNSVQIIGKQLLRSGTSIGANHTEAQASSSKRDFTNYFHHALKSVNETKFWLALLRDCKKSDSQKTNLLFNEVIEISNILAVSLLTLKNKR